MWAHWRKKSIVRGRGGTSASDALAGTPGLSAVILGGPSCVASLSSSLIHSSVSPSVPCTIPDCISVRARPVVSVLAVSGDLIAHVVAGRVVVAVVCVQLVVVFSLSHRSHRLDQLHLQTDDSL